MTETSDQALPEVRVRTRPAPSDDMSAPRHPPHAHDVDIFYFRGKKQEERVQSGRVVVVKSGSVYRAHMKHPESKATNPTWKLLGDFPTSQKAMTATTEAHEKLRVKLTPEKKTRKSKK